MSKSKILFKISGSIAAYKACFVISKLVQAGHEVRVAMSSSAIKFIGPATLEGLTGHAPFIDLFESQKNMEHIHLVKWADLVVLCPASANTINKMAQGLSDDTLGALFLAHDFKKPYLVFPAMNQNMYAHPATQKSILTLKSWGVEVYEAGVGYQACGDIGPGRMLEPEDILNAITTHTQNLRSPNSEVNV